jgi:hypothetical protein
MYRMEPGRKMRQLPSRRSRLHGDNVGDLMHIDEALLDITDEAVMQQLPQQASAGLYPPTLRAMIWRHLLSVQWTKIMRMRGVQ